MRNLYRLILCLVYICWICLPEFSFAQCGSGTFKVLHYTETSGFNHNTRTQSLAMFQALGATNGFTVTDDNSGAEFNSLVNLQQYAVVIFSNTSGNNILNSTQRANFEAYIQAGGSYIGIHAASDTYRHSSANGGSTGTWDWYAENVAGCSVQQSPNHTSQNHNNDMTHQAPGHPALTGIPDPWNKTEEYYYWENGYLNSTFTELLRVNQTGGASYDMARMTTHIKELQWGGRAFYTSLGHAQSNFSSDQNFRNLLSNAVEWTAAPNVGGGGSGLNLSANINDASCDLDNGSIDLTVSGGSGSYTYTWSNGSNSQDISNLLQGSYDVLVDDGNGCTARDTFVVENAATKPILNLNVDQEISCFGANDGSINSSVLGNGAPYSYIWNTGQTSPNLTGLGPGNYQLIVSSVANCKDTAVINLIEPPALQANIQILANPSCGNPIGGEISAQASGGSGTLSYLWNTGANTSLISGLDSGKYVLTVTDSSSCTLKDSVELSYSSFSLSLTETQSIICFGGNEGQITANISGGTAPFTYSWNNGQSTAVASNLSSGWQLLTVTDSDGCIEKDSLFLTQPDSLQSGLQINQNISCYGSADGILLSNATGGTVPYTYLWNGSAGLDSLKNLDTGVYRLEVLDARGCTALDSTSLSQPDSLSLQLQIGQEISCNGGADGQILSTATGGTLAYTYSWNNGQNTADLSGAGAGSYTLLLTDANGCQLQKSITLTEPSAINANLNLLKEVSCFGGMDGQMSVTVSGGSSGYTYNWSSGATDSIANSLSAGMQILEIRDSKNCLWTDSLLMPEPNALQLNPQLIQAASCNGVANGEAKVSVSGGIMPYGFLWSSGQTDSVATALMAGIYQVRVTDANGCIDSVDVTVSNNIPWSINLLQTADIDCFGDSTAGLSVEIQNGNGFGPFSFLWSTGATDSSLTNLPAAAYTITVIDKDACQASANILVQEPDSLDLQLTLQSPISCFGANDGAVAAVVSGGLAPYTYTWSNAQSGSQNSVVGPGMLVLIVNDANGCQKTDSLLVNEPAALGITFQVQNEISCHGFLDGTVQAIPTGGTLPYTYSWSNGQTTATANGLGVGWQVLQLQDANGCIYQDSIFLSQPSPLAVILNETASISCNGALDGELSAIASGSVGPYTYSWNNNVITPTNSNLGAGLYAVIVEDANLCKDTLTYDLSQPDSVRIDLQLTQSILCAGDADALLNATVNGGTTPYSYNWSTGATTSFLANLGPGTYSLIVNDVNACRDSASFVVNEPDSLGLSINMLQNVSCTGGMDGSASLIVTGGSPAYSYLWSNGANTPTVNNLSAGLQSVRVFDSHGCIDSLQFSLSENPPIQGSINIDQEISCLGGNDAILSLIASGGVGSLTYQWSNGSSGQTASGFSAGIANVLITDSLGCNLNVQQNLSNPPALQSRIILQQALSCPGVSDASLLLRPAGGQGPYTVQWSTGSNDTIISNLAAGFYSVVVTDSIGCTENLDTLLIAPTVINSSISLNQAVSCNGATDASIALSLNGGSLPYTFLWQDGDTNQNRTGIGAGTYVVEIRDANNCLQRDSIVLTEPEILSAQLNLIDSVSCTGDQDGVVEAVASGGTAAYTYLWSNGEMGFRAENLSAGYGRVLIRDANDCVFEDSILVPEPEVLVNSFSIIAPVSCNGGSDGAILSSVNGGSAPYQYRWNGQLADSLASNLSSQLHILEVQDVRGCNLRDSVLLDEPDSLDLSLALIQDASCETATDGLAYAEISGGLAPYQFLWSNGAMRDTLSGVGSGSYSVLVQDSLGCEIQDSLRIGESLPWSAEVFLLDSVSCYGGDDGQAYVSIDVDSSGFSFLWDSGENRDTANLLPAGIQNVIVQDRFACEQILSVEVPQPDSLDVFVSLVFTEAGQSNGSISIDSIANGSAPFSYLWSTGATSSLIRDLAAGSYELLLIDAKGCESNRSFQIDTTAFEWENFEAIPDFSRNRVQLLWSARKEINNKEFVIERSLDNILFEQHMEIPSEGDFIGLRAYEAFDLEPLPNRSYYRIKQSFFNGRFSYFSQTREVLFWDFSPGFLIAYPVPMRQGEELSVELEMKDDSETTLFIINTLNQEVYQQSIDNPSERQSLSLPTSGFSPGLYYILVNNATERYSFSFQIEG